MKLKTFQRKDLARAALQDGAILGWDCGLGKTLAMFIWPLIKVGFTKPLQPLKPVLLVASGDLHAQILEEAAQHFRIVPTLLDSQQTFLRLSTLTAAGRRELPPGFYLTSYVQLTQNGVEPFPDVDREWYCANLGDSRYYPEIGRAVRCIHSPTLADLSQDAFQAIVCDEGVRIKGQTSLIGLGVRQMNARFRLVLTGTPIKNRIGDIFHLAHFVAGPTHAPHPRFTFPPDGQRDFVRRFSVIERNLTAEQLDGRRHLRAIHQVCSADQLYRLLAPIVLRRTKENCGETVAPKIHHVVRVAMSDAQAAGYRSCLQRNYRDVHGKIAITAKLQALRAISAGESSQRAALTLIRDILQRREQVAVFSALHQPLDQLAARLREAAVRFSIMDGRASPGKRGAISAQFKARQFPVQLCGIESCAEGHSWPQASNAIIPCAAWAMDKMLQCVSRVHRLTSQSPVNIYFIITEGSMDPYLHRMLEEKTASADLVLDGRLRTEESKEVNMAALLKTAEEEFNQSPSVGNIDDLEIEKEWPALRAQLGKAMRQWERPISVSCALDSAVGYGDGSMLQVPMENEEQWVSELPLWKMVA